MNALSAILVMVLLAACTLEHEVSRVVIPNSGIIVVVVEDEKSLYRYRIYGGSAVNADGIIFGHRQGGGRDAPLPAPVVAKTGDVATIAWPGTNLQLRVDVARGIRVSE
jgi:hypothetical protein